MNVYFRAAPHEIIGSRVRSPGAETSKGRQRKMLLPRFEHHQPFTLEDACEIKAELGEKAQFLAGGTDLIVNMRKGVSTPKNVVALSRIESLKGVNESKGRLRLGACTTVDEIARSPRIASLFAALSSAARRLGSQQIRNLATVGGNLATARPAADLPLPLMSYNATITLKSISGERRLSLHEFFKGPGETVIGSDEMLTHIELDEPPSFSGGAYIKLGRRRTLVIALVNVAAFLSLDAATGVIERARIVLGAVAPTPMKARTTEKLLIGEKPSESLFKEAGEIAAKECDPIDDYRGSAEYRRAMVNVLTRRALAVAYQEALRS